MTNAQIITLAADELIQAGKIQPNEAIHTYQTWRECGFQVQKGQKAITKIKIWKYTKNENRETGEEDPRMFMKTAAFFSRSQVEAIAQ